MKSLILIFMIATAFPVSAGEIAGVSTTTIPKAPEAALTSVVAEYVKANRVWFPGTYKIEFRGREGEMLLFDVVRSQPDEIKKVIAEEMVEDFRRQHPKATAAHLAEVRRLNMELYDASEIVGQAEDPDREARERSKGSFQVLVDPTTKMVVEEVFPQGNTANKP